MAVFRILFFSDTHLGIDMPRRPRIHRRRRGDDFHANLVRILTAARQGAFDLVVHGGDVFYRSRIPASLVHGVFAPLQAFADEGPPLCIVPGNHERSSIPFPLLALHPRIHIFDRPKTLTFVKDGLTVAISGFPFVCNDIRSRFPLLLEASGFREARAQARLLCLHQAFEGATVGSHDFTFRDGPDVIRGADIPAAFTGVLAGHIHRFQVLTKDLKGRPLPAPVLYPGSIERTSFAERREPKGYLEVEIKDNGAGREPGLTWSFTELPARPMAVVELHATGLGAAEAECRLRSLLRRLHPDTVLSLRIRGRPTPGARPVFRAAAIRGLAPAGMNVTVSWGNKQRPDNTGPC